MTLGTLLLIVLILALVGALPLPLRLLSSGTQTGNRHRLRS